MNEIIQKDLQKLSAYCGLLGNEPLLVQGAGGNVSLKDDGVLWIKASGTRISEAVDENIFVPVNLSALRVELNRGNFAVSPQTLSDTTLRPSIETLLHALMPHKFVVHLHAIEPLAHLVRKGARDHLPSLMGSLSSWVCVDYFKPGADLAHAIANELERVPNAKIVFMINHGIVVGADCIEGISVILDQVIKRTTSPPFVVDNASPPPANVDLADLGYSPCIDGGINQLALHKSMLNHLKHSWALYPDHLVFLGDVPAILGDTVTVQILSGLERLPSYIFVPREGVYEHETVTSAHYAQIRCYFDVLSRQNVAEDLVTLNNKQVSEILEWDAEHYRQAQNLKGKPDAVS